jgi:hypothetical protein
MNINKKIEQSVLLWNNSSSACYFKSGVVSDFQKAENENIFYSLTGKLKTAARFKNNKNQMGKNFGIQLKQNVAALMSRVFRFSDNELAIIFDNGFAAATKKFVLMARKFDSNITNEEIFQASRNLWIANTLQVLMNKPVDVSDSLFAYSMLYPYTDNYIDNPDINEDEKHMFSKRFRMRLEGVFLNPTNEYEQRIFSLVELIENDWDRKKHPGVYNSLLAIHGAQTRSIKLMSNCETPSERELLDICIEKGGTSVLADGYLVNGQLTPEQEEFCFNFGVLLQFVDDIQDLQEDMADKLETVFTCAAREGTLSGYINKAIAFTYLVMDNAVFFGDEIHEHFKSLVLKSVKILITESIGLNSSCLDSTYLHEVEKQSVFSFAFIQKYRDKMSENRVSIMRKLTPFINSQIGVA